MQSVRTQRTRTSVRSQVSSEDPDAGGAAKFAKLYMGSAGGASFSSMQLPSAGKLSFERDRALIHEIEETVMTTYDHFAVLAQCTLLTMHHAQVCRELGAGQKPDLALILTIRGKQLRSVDMPLLAKYIGRGQTGAPTQKASGSADGSNNEDDIASGSTSEGAMRARAGGNSRAEEEQVKGRDLTSSCKIVGDTFVDVTGETGQRDRAAAAAAAAERPAAHDVDGHMFVWTEFLSVLDLSRNLLDASCIVPLMRNIVLTLPKLRALVLDENASLGSEATKAIIPYLKKTRLMRLSMVKCAFDQTAAAYLSKMTVGSKAPHPLPSTLETFDLSGNLLEDGAIKYMLSVMKQATKKNRKSRETDLESESGTDSKPPKRLFRHCPTVSPHTQNAAPTPPLVVMENNHFSPDGE